MLHQLKGLSCLSILHYVISKDVDLLDKSAQYSTYSVHCLQRIIIAFSATFDYADCAVYEYPHAIIGLLSELLLPDFVRFSCCSPIASICFNCCSLFASASAAARHLCLLQLLLPNCVRFNCYSPIASVSTAPRLRQLQLLLPDCVRFNCSPIASALAVASRLRLLQLLLRLHLQLPDFIRFDCCSPILHPSAVLEAAHAQCS